MTARGLILSLALLGLGSAAGAGAATLRDHRGVNEGLAIIAAADMIRKTCPEIDARWMRAYGYMRSLKRMANEAGFSDDQIEAFVKDKAEKTRVEGIARDWLAAQGAVEGDPQTYCAVGRAEIDRNSQVGVLLKAR